LAIEADVKSGKHEGLAAKALKDFKGRKLQLIGI